MFLSILKTAFYPRFSFEFTHKNKERRKAAFLIRIIRFSQLCRLLIMHINEYSALLSDIQWFSVEKSVFSALLKKQFSVLALLSSLLLIPIHSFISYAHIAFDIRILIRYAAESTETCLYFIRLA